MQQWQVKKTNENGCLLIPQDRADFCLSARVEFHPHRAQQPVTSPAPFPSSCSRDLGILAVKDATTFLFHLTVCVYGVCISKYAIIHKPLLTAIPPCKLSSFTGGLAHVDGTFHMLL